MFCSGVYPPSVGVIGTTRTMISQCQLMLVRLPSIDAVYYDDSHIRLSTTKESLIMLEDFVLPSADHIVQMPETHSGFPMVTQSVLCCYNRIPEAGHISLACSSGG